MNRLLRKIKTPVMALSLLLAVHSCAYPAFSAENLTIVQNHKSTYAIVIPADSSDMLKDAAAELQRCITIATEVTLPIVRDNEAVAGNIISVGQTKQAKSAGISTAGIKEEGFQIATKNKNLYIIGVDINLTRDGGKSFGSANGVYTFLQKYLGVRWLFPDDLGRDVPKQQSLKLNDISFREAPHFVYRSLPYTALLGVAKPVIGKWHRMQRMGASFRLNHDHTWETVIPASLYQEHPDWFAMIKGTRPAPKGMYKVETTNPEVVKRFADFSVETLTKEPEKNTVSIGPSDGDSWSESPESKAYYDKDPTGRLSVTPLVLKFYKDVTVAATQMKPDVKITGYIYASYLFPPSKGEIHFEKNFYPVLASSITYGFRLLRPSVRTLYADNMKAWGDATDHLFYYDIPNSFSGELNRSSAIVLPTTPDMMNFIASNLIKNDVKGLYIYGIPDWGYGAMTNYMWAQMMWNPNQNAYDIQKEWFTRAYGGEAGTAINQLYVDMEQWFTDFLATGGLYGIYGFADGQNALKNKFYAVRYPVIEAAFLAAKQKPMTKVQAERFKLLENNVITLQWRLKKGGHLPADYQSPYTRSLAELEKMISAAQTEYPNLNTFGNYTP